MDSPRHSISVGGTHPGSLGRLAQRYIARVSAAGAAHPSCAQALLDTYTLSAGPARLLAPRVVVNAVRGPKRTRLGSADGNAIG
ncbi:MAG TPA: hypothetical protein VHZ97_12385 [Pseudonocardiaceae bacterium]|nr:hypothetical protein [Pseudonocardiaceae bacterium]